MSSVDKCHKCIADPPQVGITGSYAGAGIQYVVPAALVYQARRQTRAAIGVGVTNQHRWVWGLGLELVLTVTHPQVTLQLRPVGVVRAGVGGHLHRVRHVEPLLNGTRGIAKLIFSSN